MAGIGGRIGMTTLIRLTKTLCHFFVRHQTRINSYIADTPDLTAPQKTALTTWLNGIVAACGILEIIEITWE